MQDLEIWQGGEDNHIVVLNYDPKTRMRFTGTDRCGDHEASEFITMEDLLKLIRHRESWMADKVEEFYKDRKEWEKALADKDREIVLLKRQVGNLKGTIKLLKEPE